MARTTSPRLKRHKKVLKQAKGFIQARSSRYKVAREAVLHAGQYAYIGRRLRKLLSELAISDPNAFKTIVTQVKSA